MYEGLDVKASAGNQPCVALKVSCWSEPELFSYTAAHKSAKVLSISLLQVLQGLGQPGSAPHVSREVHSLAPLPVLIQLPSFTALGLTRLILAADPFWPEPAAQEFSQASGRSSAPRCPGSGGEGRSWKAVLAAACHMACQI